MIQDIIFFLIILFITAIFLRDEFVFTVVYLFAGISIAGRLWSGYSLKSLRFERVYAPRAFTGEDVPVRLTLRNKGWLPVVWLRLQDSLPLELAAAGSFKRVVSLKPFGVSHFNYLMKTRRRGVYRVGPLQAASGDVFGMGGEHKVETALDSLIVYPKIYPLTHFHIPSRSPMGTLRHHQPIFEDPTRIRGKREYVAGDSMRRIDWKSTAATGRMQVKLYEPSISLETIIFLNLNVAEYELRTRYDTAELAIVVAASLANWVVEHKQGVGLVTNGLDPFANRQPFKPMPPKRDNQGQGNLMRILEVLARVETAECEDYNQLVHQQAVQFAWGTTCIFITGKADESLFDEIFQNRRRGINTVIVLVGNAPNLQRSRLKANYFGIPLYQIRREIDLDMEIA